jgi:hypothetical protein
MNVMELKAIGEPEREIRLGENYLDIKNDADIFSKAW